MRSLAARLCARAIGAVRAAAVGTSAAVRARRYAAAGRRVHRAIRRDPAVAPVPRAVRRRIRRYARDVLGSARHRHWLLAYTAHHGGFREGWIPDDVFALRVLPAVNTSYRNLSDARSLTRRLLDADEVPDLAHLLHGTWYDLDLRPIGPDEVLRRCFGDDPDAEVVVKAESSNQGRGVRVVDREGFQRLDVAALGDAVVQRRVLQHPDLEAIVPGCTATVRVTTCCTAGRVRTVGAYLRVGRAGERAIRAATLLRVPVVDDRGALGAFASAPDWSRHAVHPDTGFRFAGAVVPGFADLVAVCERLHARAPQFTVVGWDGIVEDDGRVAILEWNTDHPDIKFTEAALGPGFAGLGFERR